MKTVLFLGIFDCDDCKGTGAVYCTCSCAFCSGKGKVRRTCTTCSGTNRVACERCSGDGRVFVRQRIFFGDKYENCYKCGATGRVGCGKCQNGMTDVTCANCSGNGAQSSCPRCGGTREIKCATCLGEGDIRPNWSRDRMREEIADRRHKVVAQQRLIDSMPEPGDYLWKALDRWNREISQLQRWL